MVVSLTNKAVQEMQKFSYLKEKTPQFKVITTCTDLELFKPRKYIDKIQNQAHFLTIGYVGSVGTWYLFEEALGYFKLIKEVVPDARLHIINKGDHDHIHKSEVGNYREQRLYWCCTSNAVNGCRSFYNQTRIFKDCLNANKIR